MRRWLGRIFTVLSLLMLVSTVGTWVRAQRAMDRVCYNWVTGPGGVLREEPGVRYRFVHDHRAEFPVEGACRVPGASRNGYYDRAARAAAPPPERQARAARLRPSRSRFG